MKQGFVRRKADRRFLAGPFRFRLGSLPRQRSRGSYLTVTVIFMFIAKCGVQVIV